MKENRRKRYKQKPWFLYRTPTPVSSSALGNVSELSDKLNEWKQKFSLLNDCENTISQEDAARVDISKDIKLVDRLFCTFGNHLQRERQAQLLSIEKRNCKKSDASVLMSSVSGAVSSQIPDVAVEDKKNCAGFDNNSVVARLAEVGNQDDAVTEEATDVPSVSPETGSFNSSQTTSHVRKKVKRTDKVIDYNFQDACKYFALIRSSLQFPRIGMLRNEALVGTQHKKCIDIGLPDPVVPQIADSDSDKLILTISCYSTERPLSKTQEFYVLADSYLSELKDNWYCFSNHWTEERASRQSSGYFFIDGTFYDDVRDAESIRYSNKVIEWFEKIKRPSHILLKIVVNTRFSFKWHPFTVVYNYFRQKKHCKQFGHDDKPNLQNLFDAETGHDDIKVIVSSKDQDPITII